MNLDELRLSTGADNLRSYYHELILHDAKEAVRQINDETLSFPGLYALRSEIRKFSIVERLTERSRLSIEITEKILLRDAPGVEKLIKGKTESAHDTLKWMIDTGFAEEYMGTRYDEVIDMVVILLIKVFEDSLVLNQAIDIIFRRHRRSSYTYDLVWAIFEARNPYIIPLAANRLLSANPKDAELARKLLKFVLEPESHIDNRSLYIRISNWFNENCNFLFYSGEGFQQTSSPQPFRVSLEMKYICKPTLFVISGNGIMKDSKGSKGSKGSKDRQDRERPQLSEKENRLMSEFHKENCENRKLLADYSYGLYRSDRIAWDKWINQPVSEQIKVLRSTPGNSIKPENFGGSK